MLVNLNGKLHDLPGHWNEHSMRMEPAIPRPIDGHCWVDVTAIGDAVPSFIDRLEPIDPPREFVDEYIHSLPETAITVQFD